jgi:hypothetical protein
MYHYMEFDPYLISERNLQIFKEVQALRLERRLRNNHEVRGSRLITFALRLKSTFHPVRRAGTAGR